jgi:hypothetical protein
LVFIVDFTPGLGILRYPLVDGIDAEVARDELFPELDVFAGDLRGVGFEFFLWMLTEKEEEGGDERCTNWCGEVIFFRTGSRTRYSRSATSSRAGAALVVDDRERGALTVDIFYEHIFGVHVQALRTVGARHCLRRELACRDFKE